MTTVFCALKPEAEPLISELDLKPISSTLYESDDVRLMITGIGKLNASSSAGFCLGRYGVWTDIFCGTDHGRGQWKRILPRYSRY